jgi:hypothetical protein
LLLLGSNNPFSGAEEQTARAISAGAQRACLLSLQMGSMTEIDLAAMEKWLVGCGAAINGVYRAFDQVAPIAVIFYVCDCVRFSRTAQAHDALAFLRKARQGAK